jgi:hypothetical protein
MFAQQCIRETKSHGQNPDYQGRAGKGEGGLDSPGKGGKTCQHSCHRRSQGHGDLSENAEYHAAKERQSFIEGRINELRALVGQSEVIELDANPSDTVVFGKTVRLYDINSEEETSYQLLGPYESAPEEG